MSLDLLQPVNMPAEIAKLLGAAKNPDRTTAQPGEDFLAVLDRALNEKPVDKPAENSALADGENYRKAGDTHPAGDQRPATEQRAAPETVQARSAAEAPLPAQPEVADAPMLNSHRLGKYHKRGDASAEIQTVPRKVERQRSGQDAEAGVRVAATRSDPQSSPDPVRNAVQKAKPPISQGLEALGADLSVATSKKINHKTGGTPVQEQVDIGRKKLAAAPSPADNQAKAAPATPRPAVVASKGEKAAEQMQLHADSGGTKGLADALSVVKGLADRLGLNGPPGQNPADSAQQVNRTIDLSRNAAGFTLLRPAAVHGQDKAGGGDKAERTEKIAALRHSRVDVLRAERLAKSDGSQAFQIAADKGRVQVSDQRLQAPKGSLVLESLLDKASGQAGRTDEAGRKDSLQLVNTAFLTPAGERNTVSIPVHLTASQHGNLAQALRSHLENQGNKDIVQQARIVMNGQESGEIKLILKPENLGEVRIHLQMQEGHIAGQIFVENKEVQAAFEENLNSLMQAFQDGGLSPGNLQVTVDPRGTGDGNQAGQRQFAEDRSDERRKIHAVRSLENSIATVAAGDEAYSQVNLVV